MLQAPSAFGRSVVADPLPTWLPSGKGDWYRGGAVPRFVFLLLDNLFTCSRLRPRFCITQDTGVWDIQSVMLKLALRRRQRCLKPVGTLPFQDPALRCCGPTPVGNTRGHPYSNQQLPTCPLGFWGWYGFSPPSRRHTWQHWHINGDREWHLDQGSCKSLKCLCSQVSRWSKLALWCRRQTRREASYERDN